MQLTRYFFPIVAALVIITSLLLSIATANAALPTTRTLLPGNQKLSLQEITSLFQNSGNAYLAANATTFAQMSYYVESGGGNTGIWNGECCTGLMQMNQGNLTQFCNCTPEQYAQMSGAQQIAYYRMYFESIDQAGSVQTLMKMQAAGQTLGGYKVDAAMIAACIQLGVGNCQKSINNGCVGVSPSAGGDGSVNICTMAAKANQGSGQTQGGGGTCLAAQPVDSPEVFSEYGAWNRSSLKNNGWHRGADIYPAGAGGAASKGKPLYAAANGRIIYGGEGPKITGDQFFLKYLHSPSGGDSRQVSPGEKIGVIGEVGSAGKPHLHFEVLVKPSAIANTKCIPGESTDDCVFPAGGGKRDKGAYSSADSIKGAKPSSWYYVNPERYLVSRVPVIGAAQARTGRTQSLPNTCSPGTDVSDQPSSAGANDPAESMASATGTYNTSDNLAMNNADNDLRSIFLDTTRQMGIDVRAAATPSAQLSARMDNAIVHMLLLQSQAY